MAIGAGRDAGARPFPAGRGARAGRRVAASLLVVVAAAGLAAFATVGAQDDPFPHSVVRPLPAGS